MSVVQNFFKYFPTINITELGRTAEIFLKDLVTSGRTSPRAVLQQVKLKKKFPNFQISRKIFLVFFFLYFQNIREFFSSKWVTQNYDFQQKLASSNKNEQMVTQEKVSLSATKTTKNPQKTGWQ